MFIVYSGERGRNRTFNLLIKSQLLCQLSYAPTVGILPAGQFVIVAFPSGDGRSARTRFRRSTVSSKAGRCHPSQKRRGWHWREI